MSKKTNSIHAKLHLACLNPKRKDSYLVNAALQYVFIDDGIAIAANGSMVVGIDLKSHGIDDQTIQHLNGKLILASHWKSIIGKTISPDASNDHLSVNGSDFISMSVNGSNGLKYPDYKKALPWLNGQSENEMVSSFKIDINLMNIINDCLNPDGDIFAVEIYFYSENNQNIRIIPADYDDRSFILVTQYKNK